MWSPSFAFFIWGYFVVWSRVAFEVLAVDDVGCKRDFSDVMWCERLNLMLN